MGTAAREVVGAEGVVDDGAAVQAVVDGTAVQAVVDGAEVQAVKVGVALVPLAGPSVASFVARLKAVVRDQRWSLRSGGNDLELPLKPFNLVLELEQAF